MFLLMFQFIPMISFMSAAILWTIVFGISGKDKLSLWAMRLVLGLPALLNTILFISTFR